MLYVSFNFAKLWHSTYIRYFKVSFAIRYYAVTYKSEKLGNRKEFINSGKLGIYSLHNASLSSRLIDYTMLAY